MKVVCRGEIYFADLGSNVQGAFGGKRPVMVVSNDIVNRYAPTVIVAPISSYYGRSKLPTRVEIAGNGGLKQNSVVLLDQVRTVDKITLLEKIGSLDADFLDKVSHAWMYIGGVEVSRENQDNFNEFYRFVLNEEVEMFEDYDFEFKEVRGPNPVNSINNTVAEYAASFLNSKGGHIYYGITNERVVRGVTVTPQKRDEINQTIYSNLANIQPAISPDYYDITYHPVVDSYGKEVQNLFIIEIAVPISVDRHAIYFVSGNELHVRVKGVKKKLIGTEIVSYIRKKILEEEPIDE